MVAQPVAEPAGDHHTGRALRQCQVARYRAERETEPVDCCGGQAVGAFHPGGPDRHVVLLWHALVLHRGKGLVDVGDGRARHHALHRDAGVALPQPGKDGILDRVERGEVDMAALGGRDAVEARCFAIEVRHAKPGAWPHHRQAAFGRQRACGTGKVEEEVIVCARHGMGDRLEVVDELVAVHAQLLAH